MKEIYYAWKESVYLNSCHDHIFIIIWWLKLKFVTLDNFFKTSHFLKVVTLLKTSHFKSYDFFEN